MRREEGRLEASRKWAFERRQARRSAVYFVARERRWGSEGGRMGYRSRRTEERILESLMCSMGAYCMGMACAREGDGVQVVGVRSESLTSVGSS